MPLFPINLKPGFYTEQTPAGAVNRWKNGNKVRFRYGLPEKIRGWERLPDSFIGQARRLHDWVSLDNKEWVAVGTTRKLYLYYIDTFYDITPFRSGSLPPFTSAPLTNPFTTTIGSDIVVVEDTATPMAEGDFVHFSNASAVGGINIDGEYEVLSVPTPGEYTIQASAPATSSATGGGTVDWMYEISTSSSLVGGWGAGVWGGGVWGGAQETGEVDRGRLWSMLNWGEDLIANPRDGAIYWWDRTLGPTTRAVLIPNAPRKVRRILLSGQDRHLIALGADDPLNVAWCTQEDFDTWEASLVNTAGDQRLDIGSELITGIRTRNEIVLFADDAVMAMSFDGPPLVFGFIERGESLSIISPNAVAEINGVVFFMCNSDFMAYDGILRVLPCDVRNHVYDRINRDRQETVYASVNRQHNEIWWLYPTGTSEEPNEYVCYNYMEESWYYGTLNRNAMHDISPAFRTPYMTDHNGRMWKHEVGVDECRPDEVTEPVWSQLTSVGAIPAGDWASIAWSDGEYAALSSDNLESPTQIMCSADGISWTTHDLAVGLTARNWRAITNVDGVTGVSYVAVSSNETATTNLSMASDDCQNWAEMASVPNNSNYSIVWGGGKFVTTSGSTTNPANAMRPYISSNGTAWQSSPATINMIGYSIAYSPTLNIYYVAGNVSSGGTIRGAYSTDGLSWTATTPAFPVANFRAIWVPAAGHFLSIQLGGAVQRSTNGTSWTLNYAVIPATFNPTSVTMAHTINTTTGRIHVVEGGSTSTRMRWAYSDDNGLNWTLGKNNNHGYYGIAYSPSLNRLVFVRSSDSANDSTTGLQRIWYSDNDGVTLTHCVYPSTGRGRVAWSEDLGLFVIKCAGGVNKLYSSDGITWSAGSGVTLQETGDIAWSPELAMFVSWGLSSGGPAQSKDGIVWDRVTPIGNSAWRNVLFSSEQNRIVAVASAGTNRAAISPPSSGIYGIAESWQNIVAHAQEWYGLAYSPSLDLWVATSITGAGQRVMTSPTGLAWTLRNTPEDNEWRSVVWSAPLNMFAAVASSGTNRIMTSSDGLAWAAVAAPAASGWDKIIWAQNRFWATASVGANGERVMYSEDGATWLLLAADPEVDGWLALAYSDTLDEITFVGSAGAMQSGYTAGQPFIGCDPIPSLLESYDVQLGEGNEFMHCSRAIPDFLTLEGTVSIELESKAWPTDTTYTVKGPYIVAPDTLRIDLRIRGRQVAMRLETAALGDFWRFGTMRVEMAPHGRRGGRYRAP